MHLMRSLGSLFGGQHSTHGSTQHRVQNHSGPAQNSSNEPTREDALTYLGQLAKDYHLPAEFVYAVADAESSVNPNEREKLNYSKDRHGNRIVKSRDYGLMQINDTTVGTEVKDAQGRRFKIGEDVKADWRANARAGVAILAGAYHLAELEQGPGATEEDHAQQAYSQYNTGKPKLRDRYLKGKDGVPQHKSDRNFIQKYKRWAGGK
jgi:soluble lytic murein transglycosylase-like protein